MKPICFMIMPYGKKPTQAEPGKGVATLDFNRLWDHAYVPVIEELGYEPVRADQDVGALIIKEMIERLYFADLVLADMTAPNGNVYYEVGVRHAAKKTGCVLLAADWSKPLFDVDQMRCIRYPLVDGNVGDDAALAIREAIKPKIEALKEGTGPVYEVIPGYPLEVKLENASSMQQTMADVAAFQGKVRAIRAVPAAERMAAAKALAEEAVRPPTIELATLAVVRLLKDCVRSPEDWKWLADFVARLPANVAKLDEVRETNALALGKANNPIAAIAILEELLTIAKTPERQGLLGGRYKQLFETASVNSDKRNYLSRSIDAYEQGMQIDLNQYFCPCNLPNLYRLRNLPGDQAKAETVGKITLAACERAKARNEADEWLPPTLLGAAFDAGDAVRAEALMLAILAEGATSWKLESTIKALRISVTFVQSADAKTRLEAVLDALQKEIDA